MTVHAAHLRPDRNIELGGYALDAVAIEYDDEDSKFDFRFELGQGLGISSCGSNRRVASALRAKCCAAARRLISRATCANRPLRTSWYRSWSG
jgi:hypothetical protein